MNSHDHTHPTSDGCHCGAGQEMSAKEAIEKLRSQASPEALKAHSQIRPQTAEEHSLEARLSRALSPEMLRRLQDALVRD